MEIVNIVALLTGLLSSIIATYFFYISKKVLTHKPEALIRKAMEGEHDSIYVIGITLNGLLRSEWFINELLSKSKTGTKIKVLISDQDSLTQWLSLQPFSDGKDNSILLNHRANLAMLSKYSSSDNNIEVRVLNGISPFTLIGTSKLAVVKENTPLSVDKNSRGYSLLATDNTMLENYRNTFERSWENAISLYNKAN